MSIVQVHEHKSIAGCCGWLRQILVALVCMTWPCVIRMASHHQHGGRHELLLDTHAIQDHVLSILRTSCHAFSLPTRLSDTSIAGSPGHRSLGHRTMLDVQGVRETVSNISDTYVSNQVVD